MPAPTINVLTGVSWIKYEKLIRHWERRSQCTSCSFHKKTSIFILRLYFTTLLLRFLLFLHCTGVSTRVLYFIIRKENKKRKHLLFNAAISCLRERGTTKQIERGNARERDHWDAALMSRECLYTHCLIPCVIFILQVQVILPTTTIFDFSSSTLPHCVLLFPPGLYLVASLQAAYTSIVFAERERERETPQGSAFTCRVLLLPHLPPLSLSLSLSHIHTTNQYSALPLFLFLLIPLLFSSSFLPTQSLSRSPSFLLSVPQPTTAA